MTPGSMDDPGGNQPQERMGSMARTILLALALALGGGAPYLGGFADLFQAIWAAGGVDAGGHYDPNGLRTESDAGAMADPNGSNAEGDAGGMYDPNGSTADAGGHFDPDG
jgi:hypothetical protein